MVCLRIPGSICASKDAYVLHDGTMCRQQSPQPGPLVQGTSNNRIGDWSDGEKLLEAARMATPHLPAEMQQQFAALFKPEALAITGVALAAWAASHYFGIGEIIDALLLIVGVALLGWQVVTAAEELWSYFIEAQDAQSQEDLDVAARHLAKAVTIIGVAVFTALLLKKAGKGKGGAAQTAEEAALAEQALVRTLLERVLGSTKNVGTLPKKNVEEAVRFFRSAKQPLSEEQMVNYLRGMDLHKPVQIIEIEAGTVLAQNVSRGDILTKGKDAAAGQWFTRSGVSIDKLGLAKGNRDYVLYKVTEKVRVLKSKAAGINDSWTRGRTSTVNAPSPSAAGGKTTPAEMVGGGGEQYFILRDAGGRVPVTPVTP